jgi:cellulose synthase/poly-beta-1,6-N-acetylglucosamine synthase-like glycosyltransferase
VPRSTACIQARLVYHNDRQNLLTRWFAAEYDQWFGYILPGLMYVDAPIPLGGTSNHMRVDTLLEVGAWDPFNVTEDADLGIRLARAGYDTAVLDSVTLEEANSDPINWIRQRSRWYKGYLQTFFVQMRHPLGLLRATGWSGLLRFVNLMFGTPIVAVMNALFWGFSLAWLFGAPNLVRDAFPTYTYYPALISLLCGNAAIVFMGLISSRAEDKQHLVIAGFTVPLYWILMSVAATKAIVQLVTRPSYWEKTVHGLDTDRPG